MSFKIYDTGIRRRPKEKAAHRKVKEDLSFGAVSLFTEEQYARSHEPHRAKAYIKRGRQSHAFTSLDPNQAHIS